MGFNQSAYLTWLHKTANRKEVSAQVSLLLSLVNMNKSRLVKQLSGQKINHETLTDLVMWNDRLKPSSSRDRFGHAAVKFWVAQTLCTTVMRSRALNQDFDYGADANSIMENGADGLFEFATSQFLTIRSIADRLTDWIKEREINRVLIIESPLGNSLPSQVIVDFAAHKKLYFDTYVWNSPRNDRPSRGATVDDAADACALFAADYDIVIFIDDVSTGTRFLKIYEALCVRIGKDKFLPIAIVINDTERPQNTTHLSRQRLIKRLASQGSTIGYEDNWVDLPSTRLFRLDDGEFCKWEKSMVWENSDIIAGKRKVNLFFTLFDHMFDILSDLAKDSILFSRHLENAWSQDISGRSYAFAPGLIQSTFKNINSLYPLDQLKETMESDAKLRFPDDYVGKFVGADNELEFVQDRWDWLKEKYISLIAPRVGDYRARMAWRAVDNAFVASFREIVPQPSRDQAATPYVISFNKTIRRLNERLRQRIIMGK